MSYLRKLAYFYSQMKLCLKFIARKKLIFSRVHATLQTALSVGRSVGRSHFTFFYDFISLTSLLLPKWSDDLKNGPCPPARNFGSRVSGLVQYYVERAYMPNSCSFIVGHPLMWQYNFLYSHCVNNLLLHVFMCFTFCTILLIFSIFFIQFNF